ncbi:SMI1/KNR4 family protein [Paenibacillus sinopodophylli]|uniref:SMI1/KNR4 family protein n=1 Tax=Paenibacillus sinopodophylli TaxID=1837342 RepID=UPI00110CC01F|nr:SMI1/KNR4 family protein [Paenibacillus sinopodophylli]
MKQLVQNLIDLKLAEKEELMGCSLQKIEKLEQLLDVKLPACYREFLLLMGASAGRLFVGTDIFINQICHLRKEAEKLLKENNVKYILKTDSVVFSMHQGYEFNFFHISDGDNPPIYQYVEGNDIPLLCWSNIRDYINEEIENILK